MRNSMLSGTQWCSSLFHSNILVFSSFHTLCHFSAETKLGYFCIFHYVFLLPCLFLPRMILPEKIHASLVSSSSRCPRLKRDSQRVSDTLVCFPFFPCESHDYSV